jgi:hypothetical protein
MADLGIPDELGPDLDAQAAEYVVLSDLAAAQRTVAKGMAVPRAAWNDAQQTALFRLQQGEGRPQAELVDWDEADDEDDFTIDDRSRSFGWVSGPC